TSDCLCARVRRIVGLHLAAGAGDGGPGRHRRTDRGERHQLRTDLDFRRAWRCDWRLVVVLAGYQVQGVGSEGMAVVAPSRSSGARPSIRCWLRTLRGVPRTFPGAVARHGSAGGRHSTDAITEFSGGEFHVGISVGGSVARSRHVRDEIFASWLKRIGLRRFQRSPDRKTFRSAYFTMSAPALHDTASWPPVPPLQPIAPTILPFSTSGKPPGEATSVGSSVET